MHIEILMLLVMCHYLCDFPLQGAFVSEFKAKYIDGQYNPIWYHVLTAHCAIHALPVLLITGSKALAILMFVSHFIIDYSKCQKRITFNQDQVAHLTVILICWLVYNLF